MKISMILAASDNDVIGKNNQLPWHIPAELTYFKEKTLGKAIIMGRKTFESIGDPTKPLPKRTNIVISRQSKPVEVDESVIWVNSVDEAIGAAKVHSTKDEMMVIGGATIYERFFPVADRLYLTRIHANFEGDTFFTGFNPHDWEPIQETIITASSDQPYNYTFYTYDRLTK
ncbi:MAG: dihydrofolate reductase [Cellvibrionales bacterium]|nr:dihydrofolate reductase [Cellvibrionales bacterium]